MNVGHTTLSFSLSLSDFIFGLINEKSSFPNLCSTTQLPCCPAIFIAVVTQLEPSSPDSISTTNSGRRTVPFLCYSTQGIVLFCNYLVRLVSCSCSLPLCSVICLYTGFANHNLFKNFNLTSEMNYTFLDSGLHIKVVNISQGKQTSDRVCWFSLQMGKQLGGLLA